jgi:hypothetical protein
MWVINDSGKDSLTSLPKKEDNEGLDHFFQVIMATIEKSSKRK